MNEKGTRKITILVVEDDHGIREAVIEYLEMIDYSAQGACNGHEALEVLRTTGLNPDLIILDLMMPVMDGFQFRQHQTSDSSIAHIPVLIMSADGHVEEKKTKASAIAYLKKPVDLDDLSEAIEKAMA